MRSFVRDMARGVALLAAVPFYLLHRVESLVLGRERSFMGLSQLLALVPGIYGVWLRAAFYRLALRSCPQSCAIEFMTTFVTPEAVLGRNVYIGSHCNIGLADIGDDCLIGSHVLVTSGRNVHHFDDVETPIRLQGGERETTRIGRDCWIGNGAVVMADVGEGCVVAAGGVVVSPLPPYSVAAGVPARVIRKRGEPRDEGGTP
ncbi:acyltransferase [Nitratidesulfovibrio vulgaris]|nr:acyltransferase [Nitratidesulfovibrio vulgaris]ADP88286.1 transferase hexapeptide repeat containing protein [Nitratidesulfovibrio vulgaris RCH1]